MSLKRIALLSLITLAALFYFMPSMNAAILRNAQPKNPIRLTVISEGELGADGWYRSPVRVRATSTPEAVITYSLNGGEAVVGDELLLDEPGEHSIEWNACKGERCNEGFEQAIKIVTAELRPLSFDPDRREWSFPAQVVAIHEDQLLRSPAQVAKVKARDFEVWVILRIDRLALADAEVQPGDLVRVWISGPHVSMREIDWSRCTGKPHDLVVSETEYVTDTEYCSIGDTLDDGLFGLDSGYKLSPSNELIRAGRTARTWRNGALYWRTSLISEKEQ
jgi:hypothetical protein